MYHAVTLETDVRTDRVHVPLATFAGHLKWLHDNGYETITVSEIAQERHTGSKKVVLTFDDGYYSLYHLVTPLLKQYRFSATLFLTTFPVGADSYDVLSHLDKSYPENDRPLTWDELKEMEHSCWDIQAHGHRHLAHNNLSAQDLLPEINRSKTLIEYHLNKTVEYYAFPWGRYNQLSLQLTQQMGFKKVFTVQPGLASFGSRRYRLPRVEINRDVTIEAFSNKMLTGFSSRKQRLQWFFLQLVYSNVKWKDRIRSIYRKLKK